jgi:hypothetical protein
LVIRLIQFQNAFGKRYIGTPTADGRFITRIHGFECVYDLAMQTLRSAAKLETVARSHVTEERFDYDELIYERRLLPPLDHPDPAHCLVSLTGLTHLGSAKSRDEMHAAAMAGTATDSIRMFQIGLQGGKPRPGEIGAQPEWAYKGDGRTVVAPEHPITQPAFAEDGGEEAEIAGVYLIDGQGNPARIGFVLGNEFSDHVLEKRNYLFLAHSKLRQCSIGPELLVGELPAVVTGTVRIIREDKEIWSNAFESGEANMSHSIANLEHHHFKYEMFRRSGDVHVHFFGANVISFGANIRTRDGDIFEFHVPAFGRALRNALHISAEQDLVQVRSL